jgi:hypothetical protein
MTREDPMDHWPADLIFSACLGGIFVGTVRIGMSLERLEKLGRRITVQLDALLELTGK